MILLRMQEPHPQHPCDSTCSSGMATHTGWSNAGQTNGSHFLSDTAFGLQLPRDFGDSGKNITLHSSRELRVLTGLREPGERWKLY